MSNIIYTVCPDGSVFSSSKNGWLKPQKRGNYFKNYASKVHAFIQIRIKRIAGGDK